MSQNKTFIPGVDYTSHDAYGDERDFYSRTPDSERGTITRTYVPDAYRQAAAANSAASDADRAEPAPARPADAGRTLVGVLYTISRRSEGELFPLYLGRNTIGSDPESSVCLDEATVSPNHAVLLVRMVPGTRQMTVTLTDYDSEYGTRVGDVQLEYEKVVLNDHDVIAVGRAYKLLLCLFPVDAFGLSVAPDFKPCPRPAAPEPEPEPFTGRLKDKEGDYDGDSHDDTFDFYAPSRQPEGDHSTNKTVVL